MKHLFFVAVTFAFISGTPQAVHAQANVNLERLTAKKKPGHSLKFIESIEINPTAAPAQDQAEETVLTEAVSYTDANKSSAAPAIEKFSSLQFKYAMMMDMDVEAVNNAKLYTFIEDWWATRYRYGGQDKSGIDCSAFCGKLASEVYGITLDRTARDQYKQCDKVADEDLKEGDLVFFNTRGGVSHVGMYLGNRFFVHSSTSSGVTISSLDDDYYSKKFISGGRIAK
ncbi:MAG: NlpC/P60 family protein [Ferruginibacter sp.]